MKKSLQVVILLLFSCLSYAEQEVVTAKEGQAIGFHFYGALDCPPCMKFKRYHLLDVREKAKHAGFSVSENIIEKTINVPSIGSYGDSDALLREAGKQLSVVYPPIFFVTRGDVVVSAYSGDWKAALNQSITLSQSKF